MSPNAHKDLIPVARSTYNFQLSFTWFNFGILTRVSLQGFVYLLRIASRVSSLLGLLK